MTTKSTIGRRQFLTAAGAAAIAPIALPAGAAIARSNRGTSTSPSADNGADVRKLPRLFTGLCAYSFRQALGSGKMTMEDFIRKGVELRTDGVDMTAYWWKSMEPAYVTGLRHLAFKEGVPFSGAACGASMVQADASKRAQTLDEIKKWTDATAILGAPHLRIFAGKAPAGVTVAQALDWCVETMKPACEYAAGKGVTLGVENHDGVTQKADVCLELMRRVDSPYAGINLDITNFVADSDQDQYRQIEACIPCATHTHIRDRFGDSHHLIDFDRVWQMFAKGGYKGYMSVEYEGEEDPETGVPKLLDRIRELNRKYSSV
ncbi:MAG TPA: sugar phosphate isomerase/epimerase family protein [Terriglobia bacterium]|nr:sugar phosphate isomerase/epimerase family protein [Terriglobia bacterium]